MSKNKVRQIRLRLSLTQRELAEKAGTSQQQIQRIESGKIATNLLLAQAICSALGQPLEVVFPQAAKALLKLQEEVKATHYLTHERLSAVEKAGIEADKRTWFLKVLLTGCDEELSFGISASEHRRLYGLMQGEDSATSFVVFNTARDCIALNLHEVTFHQFLYEPPTTRSISRADNTEDEEQESDAAQLIFVGGRQITLGINLDEPDEDGYSGQLGGIFTTLDGGVIEANERFLITDDAGEDAFIRAGSLALLRVPLWALGEGEDEENEEEGDQA